MDREAAIAGLAKQLPPGFQFPEVKWRYNKIDSCSSDDPDPGAMAVTATGGAGGGPGGGRGGDAAEQLGPMPVRYGMPTQTILHEMIGINKMDRVGKHMDKGLAVDTPDCIGETPLFWAETPEAVDYLVREGADIEWRNTLCQCSVFYKFASNGRHKALKALGRHLRKAGILDEYVNDTSSMTMRTPLHVAALNGFTETVRELLAMGASKNLPDYTGKTPLDLAKKREFDDVIALLE